ncbi:MAG: flavodoxin [Candidatus Aminicenantes bacterium]|nr:flavodoxin [Candidatus Aminicenantes bacterium]
MKAVVVYESLWGNTAAVAGAIAEGLGSGARALSTAEATPEAVAGAELIVAGSPVMAFSLPTEMMRKGMAEDSGKAPRPPDLSHPSMRAWLASLPPGAGRGRAAAFETRFRWSPGGATGAILRRLRRAGYASLGRKKFIIKGSYGPMRDGEFDRARRWGEELARAAGGEIKEG